MQALFSERPYYGKVLIFPFLNGAFRLESIDGNHMMRYDEYALFSIARTLRIIKKQENRRGDVWNS